MREPIYLHAAAARAQLLRLARRRGDWRAELDVLDDASFSWDVDRMDAYDGGWVDTDREDAAGRPIFEYHAPGDWLADVGQTWGRCRADVRRREVDVWQMWADVGQMWGRCGGRCRADVGQDVGQM